MVAQQKRKAAIKSQEVAEAAAEVKAEVKVKRSKKDAAMGDDKDQRGPVKEYKVEEKAENAEDKTAREEEELMKARRKELKTTHVDELKEIVQSNGLEIGKKEDMVEAVVVHEAEARAGVRDRAAKTRAAVMSKQGELEALSVSELKELCVARGIAAMSKSDRVEELLKEWMQDGGVEKALKKAVSDAREVALAAMDKAALRKLCKKAEVDPFVKEVIVDRVVRSEAASGRFARPELEALDMVFEDETQKSKNVDMVEAVLASEEHRKKEMMLKKQQEEAMANKRNELKAMSTDALKKLLAKKSQQSAGKKDDMVEALLSIYVKEEAVAAKKSKLKALEVNVLNKLVLKRGLKLGKTDDMIESLLAREVQTQEAAQGYAVKFQQAFAKKKEELEGKSPGELKELCVSKNLKPGKGAEERVEHLLEQAKIDGEVDNMVAAQSRAARREELSAMDLKSLLHLCEETGTDPLVKEVMVERILCFEGESGSLKIDEPCAKKARKARVAAAGC